MAVENLHDAAAVLRGAYQAIERLLEDTEPMEREHHQRSNILLTNNPKEPQETFDAIGREDGYSAFYDQVDDLIQLLGNVDQVGTEELKRAVGL